MTGELLEPNGAGDELWRCSATSWELVLKRDSSGKVVYVAPDFISSEANIQLKPEVLR